MPEFRSSVSTEKPGIMVSTHKPCTGTCKDKQAPGTCWLPGVVNSGSEDDGEQLKKKATIDFCSGHAHIWGSIHVPPPRHKGKHPQ